MVLCFSHDSGYDNYYYISDMTKTELIALLKSDEMIYHIAKNLEPDAFSEDEETRHIFASPVKVEVVQRKLLAKARILSSAIIEKLKG